VTILLYSNHTLIDNVKIGFTSYLARITWVITIILKSTFRIHKKTLIKLDN